MAGISQAVVDPLAETYDPEDFRPVAFFSNDSSYFNWHKLYLGLQLEDNFPSSEKCVINDIVGTIDNFYQFQSNYTWEFWYQPVDNRNYLLPILNVTRMIGINFASAFPDCYTFTVLEIGTYAQGIYTNVNKDFNTLLLSFLFS